MNVKKNKGITLVALVVTIVVLLILAGITIMYVMGDNGVFGKATKARNKTEQAKAREMLEIVLTTDAQIEKQSNPKYNQDNFLNDLITKAINGAKVKGDIAIIGDYAFELDRSVPKIEKDLDPEKALVFPTITVTDAILAEDSKTSTFKVTAKEEKNGINKIELWLDGEKIESQTKTYSNEKEEIEQKFTVNRNGIYNIKVYGDLMINQIVEVQGITSSVSFEPNGNLKWQKKHLTKITVPETEEKVTDIKYKWTTSQSNPPDSTEFSEVCPADNIIICENIEMTGTYYLWILLTTGEGENSSISTCVSNAFNFDNAVPTASISTEWIEEETENQLKIKVNNVRDINAGVDLDSVKLYITSENKEKEEKKIELINGNGEITVTGLNRESISEVEFSVQDKAGNLLKSTSKVGRLYAVKNGKIVGTSAVSNDASSVRELQNGTCEFTCVGDSYYVYQVATVALDWPGGAGILRADGTSESFPMGNSSGHCLVSSGAQPSTWWIYGECPWLKYCDLLSYFATYGIQFNAEAGKIYLGFSGCGEKGSGNAGIRKRIVNVKNLYVDLM